MKSQVSLGRSCRDRAGAREERRRSDAVFEDGWEGLLPKEWNQTLSWKQEKAREQILH